MATGRMTLDELLSSLDFGDGVFEHALDATMKPTLAPKFRRGKRVDPPKPVTLPPPSTDDLNSHDVKIRGPLAEGGMGTVLLGQQSGLRRDVAVKTLKDEFLEPAFATRLLREARAVGLVEHPNIVPIYAIQHDERNAPQLVMKRIEGVPWRVLIHDDKHPAFPDAQDHLAWHLRVLMRVCDAVDYAHSRGILHLDLKPDNVMIGAFREVYLVDWGVAVSVNSEHRGWLPMADEVREIVGTPAYLAPEMVDVERETLDARTDVYLLGTLLYEILMKRPPHQGGTLQEILYAAYEAQIPELPRSVPKELAAIVGRAMNPSRRERFQSAEELRSAVAAFLEHRYALTLSRSAESALAELIELTSEEAEVDRVPMTSNAANARIQRAFGRCRFGFAEALAEWPESTRARAGLDEALRTMARYHLSRREAASAETLLEELGEAEGVDELRAEADRQRVEANRLEQLGHEESADPGQEARGRLILSASALVSVSALVGYAGGRLGFYHYEWWHTLVYCLLLAIFLGGYGLFARNDVMVNRRSRQIVISLVLLALVAAFFRAISAYLGVRGQESLAFEMSIFGSGSLLAGVLADRRFFSAAPGFFAGALAILAWPEFALLGVAIGTLVGPGLLARAWIQGTPADDPFRPSLPPDS